MLLRIPSSIPMILHERRNYWLNETFNNEFYTLLRSAMPVIGIWDDHDYGVNDGDWRNPFRADQKQLYLDYLEEPASSERRNRGDENGIYQYY
jgi:alkaline phosphatase D